MVAKYNPNFIGSVMRFAREAHNGATRADGITPYCYHPMSVAAAVGTVGGSDAAVCAAWLHDVIEDTDVKPSELASLFGYDIVSIVLELTFPANMPDRRKRMIERAATMSDDARLVKLADIYANMIDLPKSGWDADKAERYYYHLVKMRNALAGTNAKLEGAFDSVSLEVANKLGI